MQRIGIITTNSHFIPFGGAAQFIKGLYQQYLEPKDWTVDLILDQPPSQTEFLDSLGINGSVYYPPQPLSYGQHRNTFSFSDSINFEKEANIRSALMLALQSNVYDVILINSVEGLVPVYTMGLDKFINVIFYTHVELSIGLTDKKNTPFSDRFIEYYGNIIRNSGLITFATQSPRNITNIRNVYGSVYTFLAPMFLPEPALLEYSEEPREGVLFNGRWEPRKRPQEFVDLCLETGLKPRVMTSEKAKAKFEKAFAEAGIVDYDIRVGIYGKEKVDFIKGSGLCYHPSHHENFSFSVYEAMSSIPVLVDGEAYWHDNFADVGLHLNKSTKTDRAKKALKLLEEDSQDLKSYISDIEGRWDSLLTRSLFEVKKPGNNIFTRINNETTLKEWYASLGRPISIEDIEVAHKNKQIYKISQLPSGSFISTNRYITEAEISVKETDDFFEW